jgi:Beta/Gamma crystallin
MKFISILLGGALALSMGAISASADQVEHAGGPTGAPGVTLYSFPNYSGRQVLLVRDAPKLKKLGFAANAMSMKVTGGQWEVCDGNQYNGTCEVFGPGKYTFGIFNWGNKIKSVRRLRSGTNTITLYGRENMKGQPHTYAASMPRIKDFAVNDFAQSAKVNGGNWVLCKDSNGKGACETINHDVPALRTIGLGGAVSSVYRSSDWNNGSDSSGYDDSYGGGYGGGYGSGSGSGYGSNDYRNGGGYRNGDGRRYDNLPPQIKLFESYNFSGPSITIDTETSSLLGSGFSNRASSVRVLAGVWELCDGSGFTKTCRTINRDENNLATIGLDSVITSVRPIAGRDGGGNGGRRGDNARGFEGQRTVFFAEPSARGEPVANCLYRNSQCGNIAANAFCRDAGLNGAVYFDQARSYRAPYLLGARRTANQSGQQRLVDVLCRR